MDPHDTLIAPVPSLRGVPPVRSTRATERTPDRSTHGPASSEAVEGSLALGRYHLLERLGAGGFGVVWRAHDELLDREVAVKVIPLPPGEDHERATREALAAARLAHPAIVALYEACARDDAFYLISELVHGETLAQLIAAEALCDEEALEIGLALVDALLHAHERGVIHRDIKPHNVLVPAGCTPTPAIPQPPTGSPAAKLTDFGGALLAGEEGLTRTGDVLGTLAYMAPEQIEDLEVGEPADLYSLALVIYETLSGVNPVRGPTPAATARRIGRDLPPLERHRRDLPRELTRALDRALEADPEARGTLPELREAFAAALQRSLRRSPWQRHARFAHTAPGRPAQAGWLTLQRLGWVLATLALCIWQIALGHAGIALLALCAALPLVLLVRRPGPRWLAAALAPVLGLAGLAGAFPALAGQSANWRARALLGALGYWWLRLAELPLDGPARQLWLGVPAGVDGRVYPLSVWEGSPGTAAVHAILPLLSIALLLGALLWAAAAVALPWVVRGRSALLDGFAAILWAAALAALAPLLDRGLPLTHAAGASSSSPRGLILGSALGALFAVTARALRGPV